MLLDDTTGSPLPGVEVKVVLPYDIPRTQGMNFEKTTISGPDGRFVFKGLEPNAPYAVRMGDSSHVLANAVNRDGGYVVTGITVDATRFTTPADPNSEIEPLTLRVVPRRALRIIAPAGGYASYEDAGPYASFEYKEEAAPEWQHADPELAAIHRAIMATPSEDPEAATRIREQLVQKIERYLHTHPDTPFKPELLWQLSSQFRTHWSAPSDKPRWLDYATQADQLYGDRYSHYSENNKNHLANRQGHHDARVAYYRWISHFSLGQGRPEELHPVRTVGAFLKYGPPVHYNDEQKQAILDDLPRNAKLRLESISDWIVRSARLHQLHELIEQFPGTYLAEKAAAEIEKQAATELPVAAPGVLHVYAWTHRPVVIAGPDDDPRVAQQRQHLQAQSAELDDRQIILFRDPRPVAFAVTLVGKDTGEKARWTEIVDPAEIFARIDAMPMRRREMEN